MNLFESVQILSGNIWLYGGSFVLILSLLVFIHEWGHYIVARLFGVHVEQFSIGFGKEIWGRTDKSGTRWKVSMIPLGGYVKLFGDTDPASSSYEEVVKEGEAPTRPMTDKERSVAFFGKSVWKRAAIVIAGPAINYIFAIFVLMLLFTFNGKPVTPPSAAAVMAGSAAEKGGFEPHDIILSIDGKAVTSFEDVRRDMMIALDQKKHFTVDRGGEVLDIYAQPELLEMEDKFGFQQTRGLLGLISPRHAIDITTITRIERTTFESVEGADESAVAARIERVRAMLLARAGKTFEIEVLAGDKTDALIIHPLAEFNVALSNPESDRHNYLFISDISGNEFVQYPLHISLVKAAEEAWSVTTGTLEALGQIATGGRSAKELGGVIRIGALAGDMAQQGVIALVLFTAMLSINLGLINLLPIPLLDGGHLAFYFFEALLGKPIPDRIQEYAFRFRLVFLVGVMVFANLNDLLQLFL